MTQKPPHKEAPPNQNQQRIQEVVYKWDNQHKDPNTTLSQTLRARNISASRIAKVNLNDRYFDASRTAQGHCFSSAGKQLIASGVGAYQSPGQVSENSAGAVCGRRIRYSILNGGILQNATAILPYFYH